MTEPVRNERPVLVSLPVFVALPYVLLAVLAAVTVVEERDDPRGLALDLALCAVAAAWTLWMVTLHRDWWDRPRVMGLFFAVLMVVMGVLVVRDPWFGCFAPAGYVYAFVLLPWPWRQVGVALVAMGAGTAQASDVNKDTVFGLLTYAAVLVLNIVPMCGLAWMMWRTGKRQDERRHALEDLQEANRRLEASLAENADLHDRLVAQAREAGVLDERQRMAREIHDTLAQGLTGIIAQLQAAEQADTDPAGWRRHVVTATDLARESLTEARRSVRALRPEPLETARLGEALAGVAGRWSALHGTACEVTTTGTARPLPPEVEAALLRTAQEALANVAKHAEATRVGVTLSYMDHEVAVDVRDDGRGFDPDLVVSGERATGGGFGLLAMRQRIEGLAGTFQIESEPGGGTGVSACVPAAEAVA
ncbi:MAG TPA: sensor histidine kinase [Streptosporangiaceae bacterium]|jgi:signal transduction histidine kinase